MARRNRNSREKESAPGWVWMLFGLGLGLIIAVGVYLRAPSGEPAVAAAERPASRSTPRVAVAPSERKAQSENNRFAFYDILPQYEVLVGDDAPATATATTANPRPRPAETPGSYLLQVGSYGAAADADRTQASLALLGFESHVQRATLDGNVFNRVRIGPISDLDAVKRTQRQLRAAGYDPLLMQVPK